MKQCIIRHRNNPNIRKVQICTHAIDNKLGKCGIDKLIYLIRIIRLPKNLHAIRKTK